MWNKELFIFSREKDKKAPEGRPPKNPTNAIIKKQRGKVFARFALKERSILKLAFKSARRELNLKQNNLRTNFFRKEKPVMVLKKKNVGEG